MKLSIITINYNNKIGLEKTIASVMSQTWRDFEWIIIDGGSSDGSKEIIETLATNQEAKISYWCSENDKGVYDAMNKGITKAQGEYLNFMNSGDTFSDKEVLLSLFSSCGFKDVIYGNWIEVYPDHNTLQIVPYEDFSYTMLYRNICHQATFLKRNLFSSGLYNEKYGLIADWGFLTEHLLSGCTIEYCPITICRYDMGGMSSRNSQNLRTEYNRIIELYPPVIFDSLFELRSIKTDEVFSFYYKLIQKHPFCKKIIHRFIYIIDHLLKYVKA